MSRSPDASQSLFDLNLHHEYLHFRRTKIVATIGPASNSPEMLRKLIERGLDVARINFSHGDPEEHLKVIETIRRISTEVGRPVAILGDLCGPKIRVGMFKGDSITLRDGAPVTITTADVLGEEGLIPSQYKYLANEVTPGHRILLDDGNLELEVVSKQGDRVEAKVLRGGVLKNKKGMNLPDTKLCISALTEKDRRDAEYCVRGGVDYVALSFVRRPEDIQDLRQHLQKLGGDLHIVAKIEKPEALENIHEIVQLADAIMVARGDLGVELPTKKVPLIQTKLIEIANQHAKPVIVATQMLESMIEHSRPTRAEVTDVSAACLAGADAVMMSAETAAGKYPIEAFENMDEIVRETEAYQFFSKGRFNDASSNADRSSLLSAVSTAVSQLSSDLRVHCVFALTTSGNTARIISAERPAAPVIAFTQDQRTARRMHLMWGVYPQIVEHQLGVDEYLARGEEVLKEKKLATTGDYVIMLTGLGDGNLATNSIVIHRIS